MSILDAELLEDITFLSGGYPSPYINRTSSVLQVTQREGNREEFQGAATVGFAGAGAILEGPIGAGQGSWVVSARRSFLDLFTSDLGFGGVPVLYTLNAKAVYDLGARDRVWLVNVTGVDRIRLGLTEDSPGDRRGVELRHPVPGVAERDGAELATDLRAARRGPARHHALRGAPGVDGQGPGARRRAPARRHRSTRSSPTPRRCSATTPAKARPR